MTFETPILKQIKREYPLVYKEYKQYANTEEYKELRFFFDAHSIGCHVRPYSYPLQGDIEFKTVLKGQIYIGHKDEFILTKHLDHRPELELELYIKAASILEERLKK